MPFQVIPRERAFFDLLEGSADGVAAAARELRALIDDLPDAAARNARIEDLEHHGDDLTHRIMNLLSTTFVTPVDRQDIHLLAMSLDDILDSIHAVSELLTLLGIERAIDDFRLQSEILVGAADAISRALYSLRTLGTSERLTREIVRFERDGDHVYRHAIANLYSGDFPAMEVLKWKDIVEEMEAAIDRCEDVANTVDAIIVKFA